MDINPNYKSGMQSPDHGAPLADDLYPVIGPADSAERTGEKQPISAEAGHVFRIDYLLKHEPHHHDLQLADTRMSTPEAALHLLMLHFGDGENSLLMPNAEASAEQVLAQAAVMGITDVRVRKL
jgi:hypothetical protein